MHHDDVSPWIPRALYVFGLALAVTAAIDLGSTVWPFRPGDMTWRYGFLGLAAGYLQTPMLGLVIIIVTGMWTKSATAVRLGGGISLLLAVCLLAAIPLFGLDVLAMRQIRTEDVQAGVLIGGALQEVKYGMAFLVFAGLGVGALKTAKRVSRGGRARTPGIVSTRD